MKPDSSSTTTLHWLSLTLILVSLPHLSQLSLWILPVLLILIGWRYLIVLKHWSIPNRWIRFFFFLIASSTIFLTYLSLFGRNSGVALLIVLTALKILEMANRRDALLICFLTYFLVITNFLYSQTIFTTLYMGIVVWIATATLITLNDPNHSLTSREKLNLSGRLLAQALPLMIVIFILFPRISGSFWALPKDAHGALTGLSDHMSLGNLSELSLSDEIAFRAKFTGDPPAPAQSYWRGPTLWLSDGWEWRSSSRPTYLQNPTAYLKTIGPPLNYSVTLEPHNQTWLFALDLPITIPHKAGLTTDYQLLAKQPVQQRIRYEVNSQPFYELHHITPRLRHQALQLPAGKHPRAVNLAQHWAKLHTQPKDIVEQALRYFNEQPFVYSYTPAPLRTDPIDEFLFETRQGFCEHYSAAFTILMRAAGIPTKIVTGYLGGTLNPIDGYMVIRQRDAHAWNEVWLTGRGWVRIDPTGAVAPERIERGNTLTPETVLGMEWTSDSPFFKWGQQMRNSWEALNNGWNQWVLNYDMTRQKEFLTWLGFKNVDWQNLMLIGMAIAALLLIVMAIWTYWHPPKPHRELVQQLYDQFCNHLARQGLIRQASEGPLAFAQRISQKHPEIRDDIQTITHLYIKIRYQSRPEALPELKTTVKSFCSSLQPIITKK